MTAYDAVVCGAGPAGARTARDLALKGLSVLLLEEHSRVGEPCHCSGLVTARTLDAAAAGWDLVLNQVTGAVFYSRGEQLLKLTSPSRGAYAVDRVELDRRLVGQAVEAGAQLLLGAKFLKFRLEGAGRLGRGRVAVEVLQQESTVEVSAQLLVGADGAMSRVGRQLRGSPATGLVRAIGGHADYTGNDLPHHAEVFLDSAAAPGWFGWTIPVSAGVSRVGAGTTNGVRPVTSLATLKENFPDQFGKAQMTSRCAGFIPVWAPSPTVADRVLLVGDAARQVKPASGGGILTALISAEVAAEQAAKALDRGDLSRSSLASYPKAWRRRIGRELQRQHDMRRALDKLDGPKVEKLLKSIARPDVKAAVEAEGDIDLVSGLVWRILRRNPAIALAGAVVPNFPLAWLLPGPGKSLTGSGRILPLGVSSSSGRAPDF